VFRSARQRRGSAFSLGADLVPTVEQSRAREDALEVLAAATSWSIDSPRAGPGVL